MKESNRVRKLLIASAVVVLSIPAIAGAVPHVNDAGQVVARVSYADLDLSSETGLLTLYRRLQSESRSACGPHNYRQAGSLQKLKSNRDCYNDLLSKLVAKANNAKLNEIHAA